MLAPFGSGPAGQIFASFWIAHVLCAVQVRA
jgi:hypothetical protein